MIVAYDLNNIGMADDSCFCVGSDVIFEFKSVF